MDKSLCFGSGAPMRSKRTIRKARDGDLGPLYNKLLWSGEGTRRNCQCGKQFINKENEDFRFCRRCRGRMDRSSFVLREFATVYSVGPKRSA